MSRENIWVYFWAEWRLLCLLSFEWWTVSCFYCVYYPSNDEQFPVFIVFIILQVMNSHLFLLCLLYFKLWTVSCFYCVYYTSNYELRYAWNYEFRYAWRSICFLALHKPSSNCRSKLRTNETRKKKTQTYTLWLYRSRNRFVTMFITLSDYHAKFFIGATFFNKNQN